MLEVGIMLGDVTSRSAYPDEMACCVLQLYCYLEEYDVTFAWRNWCSAYPLTVYVAIDVSF